MGANTRENFASWYLYNLIILDGRNGQDRVPCLLLYPFVY